MSSVDDLKSIEINSNLELKEYLDKARRYEADMYFELSMAAGLIEDRIKTIKGVTNRVRAKIIGSAMYKIADMHKAATVALQHVWLQFEKYYKDELEAAPSRKRRPKDNFTFK